MKKQRTLTMKLAASATILLLATGCSDEPPSPGSSPLVTASGSPSSSAPAPDETTNTDRSPQEALEGVINGFTHGAHYHGVYVFVGSFDDPGYDASIKRLKQLGLKRGINFSDGELRCDEGAAEGLGLSDDEAGAAITVAAYFHDASDARAFAASLDPPPEGVVRIRALCAD